VQLIGVLVTGEIGLMQLSNFLQTQKCVQQLLEVTCGILIFAGCHQICLADVALNSKKVSSCFLDFFPNIGKLIHAHVIQMAKAKVNTPKCPTKPDTKESSLIVFTVIIKTTRMNTQMKMWCGFNVEEESERFQIAIYIYSKRNKKKKGQPIILSCGWIQLEVLSLVLLFFFHKEIQTLIFLFLFLVAESKFNDKGRKLIDECSWTL
jgi:hypothetical protein